MKKLVVVDAYCTHAKGSDCVRCTRACPHGAITLAEGAAPVVDDDFCTGCGICSGICDAFASTTITMLDLHARMRRIAADGRRVYLTCSENVFPGLDPADNVIELPCLAMISPILWTLLLAEEIRLSVACDLSYCDDCDRAGALGGALFPRAIEIAQERTGSEVKFSPRIPEKKDLLEKYVGDEDPTSRRAVFASAATDVVEIASGKRRLRNSEVLADYYQRKERQRAVARLNLSDDNPFASFAPEGTRRKTLFPQQKMLLEAIERRHDIAQAIAVLIARTNADRCQGDGACLDACPTGARQRQGDATTIDPLHCVGCGICVEACPHGAIALEAATATVYLDAIAASERKKELPGFPKRSS